MLGKFSEFCLFVVRVSYWVEDFWSVATIFKETWTIVNKYWWQQISATKMLHFHTFVKSYKLTLSIWLVTFETMLSLHWIWFQEPVCPIGDSFHHITVTPVTLSSSNTNIATTNSGGVETQKNPVKTDHPKKGGKNISKGLKKSEHKSRMSLMHFSRKAESSSEEEQECGAACAPSTEPAPARLQQAITFSAADRSCEEERLSFRDPLPSAFPHRGEKSKNQKEEKRRVHHAPVAPPSQSDWIWNKQTIINYINRFLCPFFASIHFLNVCLATRNPEFFLSFNIFFFGKIFFKKFIFYLPFKVIVISVFQQPLNSFSFVFFQFFLFHFSFF